MINAGGVNAVTDPLWSDNKYDRLARGDKVAKLSPQYKTQLDIIHFY